MAKIEGTIAMDGVPLSTEIVVLDAETKAVAATGQSTAQGDYSIDIFKNGDYYVMAIPPEGYRPLTHGPVFVEQTGDPHWPNVVSLLRFDNGIVDATGRTWTLSGSANINTANPAFGSGCIQKTGSDGVIYTSADDDFVFDGDFTIEAFIKTDPGASQSMLIHYSENHNAFLPLYLDSAGSGRVFLSGGNAITGLSLPVDEWYHYAVIRASGVLTAYINGVASGSASRSQTVGYSTGTINLLGSAPYSASYINWRGCLDELRITKGVARYTENFTPPNAPFPAG
jgi:hypothetical protein